MSKHYYRQYLAMPGREGPIFLSEAKNYEWPLPLTRAECYQWIIDNAQYDLEVLPYLLTRGSYETIAEKDRAEFLRNGKGRLYFCYDLALTDHHSYSSCKTALKLLFDDYENKYAANLPDEKKLAMVENMALAGHYEAQQKYCELIKQIENKCQANGGKWLPSGEQRKKLGKMAISARKHGSLDFFSYYFEEKVTLRKLANYQKLLVFIDNYYLLTN